MEDELRELEKKKDDFMRNVWLMFGGFVAFVVGINLLTLLMS